MDKYLNTELSFEERAEDLVSKMKIEEKVMKQLEEINYEQ